MGNEEPSSPEELDMIMKQYSSTIKPQHPLIFVFFFGQLVFALAHCLFIILLIDSNFMRFQGTSSPSLRVIYRPC